MWVEWVERGPWGGGVSWWVEGGWRGGTDEAFTAVAAERHCLGEGARGSGGR